MRSPTRRSRRRLRGHLQQEPPLSRLQRVRGRAAYPARARRRAVLGMQKFIAADADLTQLFRRRGAELVHAPNTEPPGSTASSAARHHGDFDDDRATVISTLARILGKQAAETAPSSTSMRARRGCDSAGRHSTGQPAEGSSLAGTSPSCVQQRPRSMSADGGSPCSSSILLVQGAACPAASGQ